MGKLSEALLAKENRPRVVQDCVKLVDEEVRRKSGLSGLAIKGGYKVFCKVKPTATHDAMDSLLDEFVEKLDPIHEEFLSNEKETSLERFLKANGNRVADTLLGITDSRANHSPTRVVRKAYFKLRPMASKQIQEALPAVARLVRRHT